MSNKHFKEILDCPIMEIGITDNGLEITKSMVENSLESFLYKPIVYKDEQFLDYTDDDTVNKFIREKVVGMVVSVPKVIGNKVLADILLLDQYVQHWNGKYDNWCVYFDGYLEGKFDFYSLEIYSPELRESEAKRIAEIKKSKENQKS